MSALQPAVAAVSGSMSPPEVITLTISILASLALAWKELSTRRKLKSEAKALDLTTPAQVDNLNATTHRAEMDRVLAFNAQVLEANDNLIKRDADRQAEQDAMNTKMNTILENQRKQDAHSARLELWLEQAYTYIEELLAWIDRHVPGSVPPVPPRNYRPRFTREDTAEDATK